MYIEVCKYSCKEHAKKAEWNLRQHGYDAKAGRPLHGQWAVYIRATSTTGRPQVQQIGG
jgi:hypothetical protein